MGIFIVCLGFPVEKMHTAIVASSRHAGQVMINNESRELQLIQSLNTGVKTNQIESFAQEIVIDSREISADP